MKKLKFEELLRMKDTLERLQRFVYYFSAGEVPYFYRMLDYMKNNIEIYLCTGEKDWICLEEILYRDWNEANNLWYGLPSFKVSEEICEESVELYYQYSILVQELAEYFSD